MSRTKPRASSFRKLIDKVLVNDSDFEAFVLDYFPEIKRLYGVCMDRTTKVNLLFEHIGHDKLHEALCHRYPHNDLSNILNELNIHNGAQTVSCVSDDSAITSENQTRYYIVLTGTIDEVDKPKIRALMAHIRKISEDADLTLEAIRSGSIILHLKGTSAGWKRLMRLFKSGEIQNILEYPIETIDEINPHMRSEAASLMNVKKLKRSMGNLRLGSIQNVTVSSVENEKSWSLLGLETLRRVASSERDCIKADPLTLLIEGKSKHEQILRPGKDPYICRYESGQTSKPPERRLPMYVSSEELGEQRITEISPEERQFVTRSPYISQKHAVLRFTEHGKIVVKDLGNTNGTRLRLTPNHRYTLPDSFARLLAKELVVQRRTPLWETTPELGRFDSASDFAAYIHSQLHDYVVSARIVSVSSPEMLRENNLCTKLPLLTQHGNRDYAYLVATWRLSNFDLALERWLQSCVFLFNSGPSGDHPPLRDECPWAFVAASMERRHVLKLAQCVARTGGAVLLCGPRGAGKEVLARDIHLHSSRANKPFIAVNCAALPADLMEAELFGTKSGAFPHAVDRIGLFERAKDGTLYLDEVGELPLNLQAKLLRVLEQKVMRRIGDTDERPIRARIIAATNRNLEEMVTAGTFRSDLGFRLGAVHLHLPSLRPSDVAALVPHLCASLESDGFPALAEETVQALSQLAATSEWRGDGHELRSALERYLTFRDHRDSVEEAWRKALQGQRPITQSGNTSPPTTAADLPATLGQDFERLQKLLFLTVARRILVPYRRGALKELGDKMGMTGAAAAARLRKLAITTEPQPSAAQLDAEIAVLQAELKPRLPLLRCLLGL